MSQRGFSTIEVIAAVAIVAIALVPIGTLLGELARGHARLEAAQAESSAVHNAISLLRDINPMQAPSGAFQLDAQTTLTWRASPISSVRRSVNPAGFELQLFRIDAEVRRNNEISSFAVEITGWRPLADAMSRPE
ncbi:MAG: hypothetical protein A4S17_11560 [Proteobacteria bacterium HN_bin10]|nr:MAG: hypothetical protein A4S17_11560 [Proteobacteria bacterium HN_bin10]